MNLYRLLRLGIPQHRLSEFLGDQSGGPYQVTALLLACQVGMPSLAKKTLLELRHEAGPGRDVVDVLASLPLSSAIKELRKEVPVHSDSEAYRRWSTAVARYGFETYDLFTGDQD